MIIDPYVANGDWPGLREILRQLALPPQSSYDDGSERQNQDFVNFVYQRAATIPSTPTDNGIPTGWSDAPPAADGNPLWMTKSYQRHDGTLVGTWSTPIQQDSFSPISITDIIGHWKLNDNAANTDVLDSSNKSHNGTASANTSTLSAASKSGSNLETCFDLSGTDYVTIPDHADFTFGDGSNDSAFSTSIFCYIPANVVAQQVLLSKYNTSHKEWVLYLIGVFPGVVLELYDNSASASIVIKTDGLPSEGWHHIFVNYDGRGGTTAYEGVNFYIDNIKIDVSVSTSGTYVAMENKDADLIIGANSVDSNIYQDKIDNVIIFNKTLTPSEFTYLYNNGNGTETFLGTGLERQFSTNATDWHDVYADGDIYMRQKVSGGSYGNNIQIVGEGTNGIVESVHLKANLITVTKLATAVSDDIQQGIDDAAAAQATADAAGGIETFYQDAIPTALTAGDIWYDTNDSNKMYRATAAGDDQITAGEWENVDVTTIDGGNIQTGTILAGSIGAGEITAVKMDVDSIVANNIVAQTITFAELRQTAGSEAVDTDAIRDDATNIVESAYTAGQTTVTTLATVQEDNINSQGGVVEIVGSIEVQADAGDVWYYIALYEGSTALIQALGSTPNGSTEALVVSASWVPGSGTKTFYLKAARTSGAASFKAGKRSIQLKESLGK